MNPPGSQFEYGGEALPSEIPSEAEEIAFGSKVLDVVEKIEHEIASGQKILDSHKRLFTSFAKDTSLSFRLSDAFYIDLEKGEVNLAVQWFSDKECTEDQIMWAVLHEIGHFRAMAEDPEGTLQNFEHVKERAKATGEDFLKRIEEVFAESNPELLTKVKAANQVPVDAPEDFLTPLQSAAYKSQHRFYNVLEDIFNNKLVSRKAPKFEEYRAGGKDIERLYREKLFKETDYTNEPRHMQFLNHLLRKEMVPDEDTQISDEVAEFLKKEISYKGKKHTVQQIIDRYLKPKSGRDTTVGARQAIIRETIEPVFDELLRRDIAEWKPEPPQDDSSEGREKSDQLQEGQQSSNSGTSENSREDQETDSEINTEENQQVGSSDEVEKEEDGAGEKQSNEVEESQNSDDKQSSIQEFESSPQSGGNGGDGKKTKEKKWSEKPLSDDMDPFSNSGKRFDEANPDNISEQQIREWIKGVKEKIEEEKQKQQQQVGPPKVIDTRTSEQKAQDIQDERDVEWLAENNIDPQSLENFRTIEREIEPYLEELSVLWRHIVLGSSTEMERGREGFFKTGELNVPKAIEEWPKIAQRKIEEVKVMERIVSKENKVKKPELIRVRLVGDASGSMDEEKRHVMQQVFVLILSSLREFNTYLNINRQRTNSKLQVDTEAWIFGSTTHKVKSFHGNGEMNKEKVEMVGVTQKLQVSLGYTFDHLPLGKIFESLSTQEKEAIVNEKIMEIVFEVTDGGSSDPHSTRLAVDGLLGCGVIVKSFQIGRVESAENEAFNDVWNKSRPEPLGEVVGINIGNLIPAITSALKGYLGSVRL